MELISAARRWLQKPGATDLRPFQRPLPDVAAQEGRLRGLTDAGLTPAAAKEG